MHFSEVSYKHLERIAIAEDYIEWATQLIELGATNQSLINLAALYLESSHDLEIVQRHFENCLNELELSLPADGYEAILKYATHVCELVVAEKISAESGVNILFDFGETYDLLLFYIWLDLADDLSSFNSEQENHALINCELRTQDRNSFTRQVANQFIKLCNIELPDRFPCIALCEHCGFVAIPLSASVDDESFSRCSCGMEGSYLNMRLFSSREVFLARALTTQSSGTSV